MTGTADRADHGGGGEGGSRPWTVWLLIAVLGFLGVTALGGGIEMVLWPRGNRYLDRSLLDAVPVFDTFVVPGLVLGGLFGAGSLVTMVAVIRRPRGPAVAAPVEAWTGRHWSWAGAAGIGSAFSVWMVVEVSLLGGPWDQPTPSERDTAWMLYGIYVTVAALLVALTWSRSVRRHLARVRDVRGGQ